MGIIGAVFFALISQDANLIHYSGYTQDEIITFAKKIIEYLQSETKYKAIENKYASKKFMKASLFTIEFLKSCNFETLFQ